MDPTIDVQSTVLERIHRSSKEQLRTVQHYFDRRHLEASLASLLQAASGHEGRGLAPGSALYLVLFRESQLLTTNYCQRWHVSHEHSFLTSKTETPRINRYKSHQNQIDHAQGSPKASKTFLEPRRPGLSEVLATLESKCKSKHTVDRFSPQPA